MTLQEFRQRLPARGVLAGIDLGTKTIGLAFSDVERRLAGPGTTIRRTKLANDLAALREELAAREATAIILGMPLNMDGSRGPAAQRTRAFARELENAFPLPLLPWDERLSTQTAREAMTEAGVPRSRWAQRIDAFAAAAILKDALERLALAAPGEES